jgi:hypothetical protein
MYGYATVAGVGADVTIDQMIPGGGEDNECASIAPTQPYFLIKAKGDTDGDGIAATVIALSCSNQVIVTNAGE